MGARRGSALGSLSWRCIGGGAGEGPRESAPKLALKSVLSTCSHLLQHIPNILELVGNTPDNSWRPAEPLGNFPGILFRNTLSGTALPRTFEDFPGGASAAQRLLGCGRRFGVGGRAPPKSASTRNMRRTDFRPTPGLGRQFQSRCPSDRPSPASRVDPRMESKLVLCLCGTCAVPCEPLSHKCCLGYVQGPVLGKVHRGSSRRVGQNGQKCEGLVAQTSAGTGFARIGSQ